jgi:hypothetical protein
MHILEALSYCRERSVELKLDGDRLKLVGNKEAIDDKLLSLVRQHRDGLIELLRDAAGGAQDVPVRAIDAGDRFAPQPTSFNQQRLWFLQQLGGQQLGGQQVGRATAARQRQLQRRLRAVLARGAWTGPRWTPRWTHWSSGMKACVPVSSTSTARRGSSSRPTPGCAAGTRLAPGAAISTRRCAARWPSPSTLRMTS